MRIHTTALKCAKYIHNNACEIHTRDLEMAMPIARIHLFKYWNQCKERREKQLNIPVPGKNIVLNCRMLECDMFFSVSENETGLISSLLRPRNYSSLWTQFAATFSVRIWNDTIKNNFSKNHKPNVSLQHYFNWKTMIQNNIFFLGYFLFVKSVHFEFFGASLKSFFWKTWRFDLWKKNFVVP